LPNPDISLPHWGQKGIVDILRFIAPNDQYTEKPTGHSSIYHLELDFYR